MSILLWITIEMEYKIKCLKFILFFTNGRQKFDPERVNVNIQALVLLTRNVQNQEGEIEDNYQVPAQFEMVC